LLATSPDLWTVSGETMDGEKRGARFFDLS
jgi:hypothetical protein